MTDTETIKFIDLFGGIGGFRHGLEQASDKYECVDYIEYDKYAVKSYNEIFGEEHEPRDVTQLSKSEIKDHDLLCAGFPCQSFSVAGNRQGTDEARGKLFREIVRIAEAKRPEMLLLENVKGILSQKVVQDGESVEGTKGHAFTEVLQALHELGYCLEWQVLNSKHWGVPQNRERVFIIGHLGGEPRSKVFPIGREDRGDTGEDGRELEINSLGNVNPSGKGMNGEVYEASKGTVMPTVSTNKGEGQKIMKVGEYLDYGSVGNVLDPRGICSTLAMSQGKNRAPEIIQNHRNIEIREHGKESPTLNKKQGGGQLPMVLNHQFRPKDRPSIEKEGQSGGSGLLYNSDYSYAFSSSPHYCIDLRDKNRSSHEQLLENSPTLRSQRHGISVVQLPRGQNDGAKHGTCPTVSSNSWHENNYLENEKRIRKLTPKECWRLQGFPDSSFEAAQEVNSDTQLYKQAGNAVTVNVIKALGEKIQVYFRETDDETN